MILSHVVAELLLDSSTTSGKCVCRLVNQSIVCLCVFLKLQISDEGGGIPRSGLPKIFTYLYSTARNPLDENLDLASADRVTMAGYGCGLPISRLYARYFGGDLQIISMEGYGEFNILSVRVNPTSFLPADKIQKLLDSFLD